MLGIITDPTSDTPPEIKEYYRLHVIPTPVVIDGEDYLDGETIRPPEFYEIRREGKREISTYHINPDMFEEAFRKYAEMGVPVLYACFPIGTTATWNAAHIARENLLEEYPESDLSIMDSQCASADFGLPVYYLLRLQEKGTDREMFLETAEYYRGHIRHVSTMDTLEYLIHDGRITRGKGMVAETLSTRPVTTMDEEGGLKILRLVQETKKAYRVLAEYVAEHGTGFENQPVAFCHGTVPEAVEGLMGIMESMGTKVKWPVVSQVGYAIGVHTGRRVVRTYFLDVVDRYGAFEEAVEGV